MGKERLWSQGKEGLGDRRGVLELGVDALEDLATLARGGGEGARHSPKWVAPSSGSRCPSLLPLLSPCDDLLRRTADP